MSTSRTDTAEYRAFCARAAADPMLLAPAFRSKPEYRGVLDVSFVLGERYRAALDYDPGTDDPVMLRYHHQRAEIFRLLGRWPAMKIVEIGGGFGGLASLLLPWTSSYEIVDLPEVRALQDAYLRPLGRCTRIVAGTIDLLISCYAFSELTPEVQHRYARDYLRRATRGYMVCNFLGGSLDPDELLALAPDGARYEPEVPCSHPDNRVLIWGPRW